MRGKFLARLPEDAGKTIACGNGQPWALDPNPLCEGCSAPAALVVQGETDSFGFEVNIWCKACYDAHAEAARAYENAMDVIDRAPSPGHLFLVSEETNHDGRGSWCRTFRNYRSAVAYYRAIARRAERWQGLYPGAGVREMPEAEALAAVKAEREWRNSLCYDEE